MTDLLMNSLPDVDDVPPLSDDDQACLRELKEVLKRHGKINRFGLTLLHNHFRLEHGEVLVETCHAKSRTLTIRPVAQSELRDAALVETSWRLDIPGALAYCMQKCQKEQDYESGKWSHEKLHDPT